MSLLLDTTVRISIIVAVGLGAGVGLRKRSAAVRHWVLVVSIGCAAAMPLLQLVLPAWHADASTFWATGTSMEPTSDVTVVLRGPGTATTNATASKIPASPRPWSFSTTALMLFVWLAGALIGVATLIAGVWRIARLSSSARRIETGPLAAIADHVREALNLRQRITLLQSTDPDLLVTWGAVRPKVILPRDASQWSDDRARVVLQHELAHIARGDWPAQMLAETLRATYWFNPLVWVACRRLRDESERACDDVVLRAGVRPAEYASHLLDLARDATTRPRLALGMARSSSLEGRVHAMLNSHITRQPMGLTTRVVTLFAFACLTAPVAAAQNGTTFRGAVVDQTNRYVPGATVVLTPAATNAATKTRTDPTGHFEFPNLSSGDYQLVVQQPGFKAFKETVAISGGEVTRNIHLQIGTVEETLKITASLAGSAPQPEAQGQLERSRQRAQEARVRADQKCGAGATPGDIGGQIVPPLKLTHVRPDYPETLKASGIGGDVTLNALIGTDGTVREVTVVSSPHAELERVAIDAVRRWEFSTTYLNCTPVEVPMRVNFRFVAQQ